MTCEKHPHDSRGVSTYSTGCIHIVMLLLFVSNILWQYFDTLQYKYHDQRQATLIS